MFNFNVAYIDLQHRLYCQKRGLYRGSQSAFWNEEAAVAELVKGCFCDTPLMIKGLFEIGKF